MLGFFIYTKNSAMELSWEDAFVRAGNEWRKIVKTLHFSKFMIISSSPSIEWSLYGIE